MKDGFGVEHIAKAAHHHSTRKLLKELVGEVAGQGYSTTKRRAKKSRVSKAKLPRIKRLTWNQPHDNDAADTIIHNGRALKDPDERMQAHTQMNNANRIPKFFSPYRVREIPASGGAIPLQPTGKGARRSDTVFVERKRLYEIPAVQVGSGAMAAGAVGGGVYALHRKSKVSKIAMRPVFHGTTPEGANKLLRFVKAKDTSKSSFKYVVGKPRTDGTNPSPGDTRPEGLYTTKSKSTAEHYSMTGRSPDVGGMIPGRRSKGRVLVFNSVGVKPKYTADHEEVYDPKELGAPLKVLHTKRTTSIAKPAQRAAEKTDKEYDEYVDTLRRIHKPDPGRLSNAVGAALKSPHPLGSYQTDDAMREAVGEKAWQHLPKTAEVRAAGRKRIFGNRPKTRPRRDWTPPPNWKPEFV